jgi:nucleotide-binding universal stress UspA family protein
MDTAKHILAATDFSELGRGAVEHALDLANKLAGSAIRAADGLARLRAHGRAAHAVRSEMVMIFL